jgi:hypothetical protein
MSEMAIAARAKAREKVERLTRTPKGDVDASGWREPLGEQGRQSGLQTGPRPISPRQFRRGGKVHGGKFAHAGRKPRASGGGASKEPASSMTGDRRDRASGGMTVDDYMNRDMKDANMSREGPKHLGGMKKGGRTHKMMGGPMMGAPERGSPVIGSGAHPPGRMMPRPEMRGMMRKDGGKVEHGKGCSCSKCSGGAVGKATGGPVSYGGSRPVGGRIARKEGGRAKKGTTVNIIIAPGGGGAPKPMMPPPGMPPPPPGAGPGLHQGMPPPMPPGMPPGGAPPMGPPQMRASGGRTSYPIKTGGGGGKARLAKIRAYGP